MPLNRTTIPLNLHVRQQADVRLRANFGVYSAPSVDRTWGILLGLYGDNGKESGNDYI